MDNEGRWPLMGYYSKPSHSRWHRSWAWLGALTGRSRLLWLCIGDFNDILFSFEKHGGRPLLDFLLAGFRIATEDGGLFNL